MQRLDNFCTDTANVEVLDYQSSPQAIVIVDPPTCTGDGDGSIFIETDPANAPYDFKLNGKSYGSNPSIHFLDGGEYLLEVTDGNGCVWTTEVTLNEPAPLVLDLGADLVVEYGETVTLTANVTVPPTALDAVPWQQR